MVLRTLAVAVLGWSASALAQVPTFDAERLTLNPGSSSLVLSTGDGLEAGALRLALWGHYEHDPVVFTVNGARVGALIGSRVTAHVLAAYGVTSWAEVSLALPLVVFQSGDDLSSRGLAAPTSLAPGALLLQGRGTFLRQASGAPVDLGLSLGFTLPTGLASALTRDPGAGVAFVPRVGAGRVLGEVVRVGAELGVVLRGAQVLSPASVTVADEVGPSFTFGAAVSTVTLPVQLELSLRGEAPFTRSPAGFELLLGARYRFAGDFEVSALGGPGLGHAPGTPAYRLLAGVSWAPRFGADQPASAKQATGPDRDGDGVPDARDLCPDEAGLAKLRGCADVDSDGDGVKDLEDACPKEQGLVSTHGCP